MKSLNLIIIFCPNNKSSDLHSLVWRRVLPKLNPDLILDKLGEAVDGLGPQPYDVPGYSTWRSHFALLPMGYAAAEGENGLRKPQVATASSDLKMIQAAWKDGRSLNEKSEKEKGTHFPPPFFLSLIFNIDKLLTQLSPCIISRKFKKLFPPNLSQSWKNAPPTQTNEKKDLICGHFPLPIVLPGFSTTVSSQLPLLEKAPNLPPLMAKLPSEWSSDPQSFSVLAISPEFQTWLLTQIIIFIASLEQDSRGWGGQLTELRSIHTLRFKNADKKSENKIDGKTCMYQMRISLMVLELKTCAFRLLHQVDEGYSVQLHKHLLSELFWAGWKRQVTSDPLPLIANAKFPHLRKKESADKDCDSPEKKRRKLDGGLKTAENIVVPTPFEQDVGDLSKSVFAGNSEAVFASACKLDKGGDDADGERGDLSAYLDRIVADETGESAVEAEYLAKNDKVLELILAC